MMRFRVRTAQGSARIAGTSVVPRSLAGGTLRTIEWALLAAGLAMTLALLVGCGGISPGQVIGGPPYAYLHSRVDYPLQVIVGDTSAVTLTLSPDNNLLTAEPTPGSGVTSVGEPIPLPTNLAGYSDIGASAEVVSEGTTSPLVWQLVSPYRQSLLTSISAGDAQRRYVESVTFHWRVTALAAGQSTQKIALTIYYIYRDGSEHDGNVELTAEPIPMIAVARTPLNSDLPPLRLPIAGLAGLASLLALLRFLWGVLVAVNSATSSARDTLDTARLAREAGRRGRDLIARPPDRGQQPPLR